ncbi:YuxH family protein [Niallia nealsonii]|uniref:EAL domain-containing protein n=1 Tax=Niallia nealsonii TaxID=115979 RepID=UPI001F285D13|nr:EAL domain-containing protein [Niallia nealsonii]
MSAGKPCFINFTENLLELGVPAYFQPRDIVIELLETIKPSKKIVHIYRELKTMGYKIALDDFTFRKENAYAKELLLLADIIKIDFRNTIKEMRMELETLGKSLDIMMVAEKIETMQEYK